MALLGCAGEASRPGDGKEIAELLEFHSRCPWVALGNKYFNPTRRLVILSLSITSLSNNLPAMTTSAGNPVADNQISISAGPRGPLPTQDRQLLEKLAHQNRERISGRAVHAKAPPLPARSRSRTTSRDFQRPSAVDR